MEAADEIGMAVIATTFSLVAVFLPTAFMGGIPGIIFKQFGITAAVSVLFSLLVARLITPMMAAYMLKSSVHVEKPDGWLMRRYMGVVKLTLRRRWIPVLGVTAFFGLTVMLIGQMSTGFFPASDESQTRVVITAPPGSRIEQTDASALAAVAAIKDVEHVESSFLANGSASSGGIGGGGDTESVTSATLVVNLTPIDDRDVKQSQIEAELRNALTGIAGVRLEVGTGVNGTELLVTLAGDDAEVLEQAAATLEAATSAAALAGSAMSPRRRPCKAPPS